MKLYIVLSSVLLATISPLVTAQERPACYATGLAGLNLLMNYHAVRACGGYSASRGVFQGVFLPAEGRRVCVDNGSGLGTSLNMFVRKLGSPAADIADLNCWYGFSRIIEDCDAGESTSRGGTFSDDGWYFELVLE